MPPLVHLQLYHLLKLNPPKLDTIIFSEQAVDRRAPQQGERRPEEAPSVCDKGGSLRDR